MRELDYVLNRTGYGKATPIIRDLMQMSLGRRNHVLRHHCEKPIEATDELDFREALDVFLEAVGLIGIAALAGYVPESQLAEFKAEVIEVLEDQAVERFYKEHYPISLPKLVQLPSLPADALGKLTPWEASDLFVRFLRIADKPRLDGAIWIFLRFLDDYHVDGISKRTLYAELTQQNCLRNRVRHQIAGENHDILDFAISGMIRFIDWCELAYALFEQAAPAPLIQSAFWHYQGYYFDLLGRDDYLDNLMTGIANTNAELSTGGEVPEAVRVYLDDARSLFRNLARAECYRGPIEDIIQLDGPWLTPSDL